MLQEYASRSGERGLGRRDYTEVGHDVGLATDLVPGGSRALFRPEVEGPSTVPALEGSCFCHQGPGPFLLSLAKPLTG